jgi:hypothetical protein
MSTLAVVLRWLHIVPAVIGGGAAIYARFALMPALATLPEAQRVALKESIDGRWRIVVMACIGLLLASGTANFILYQAPAHQGQPLYHALFGIKFLAAMGVFFLASVLSGRAPAFDTLRANGKLWGSVTAGLVILILLISGILRSLPHST